MANKFKEKQFLAEILDKLYREVQAEEDSCRQEYTKVGVTDEQDRQWQTGELLWEDEEKTIPKMKAKWDYVAKSEEELTPDDCAKIKACQYLKAQLEKMI
jgi:hypothetical protein